ncbi:DUF5715 family protein [Longimicrobium sp.]|uniref:DUF5715 family protein n=1 Tax=Longimicrobium sp. TaxID=2029185 RepID=UPI002E37F1A2|nr:DUF5715 family protein [Longimicrobium sp.]HEX6042130.1 DUF5715 family protein [Longimicrobium sp.]
MRSWILAGALAVAAAGCGGDEHRGYDVSAQDAPAAVAQAARPAPPPPPRPMTAADSARERTRIDALRQSVTAAFAKGSRLKAREVAELRLDKNAMQVASAQRLGLRVSGDAETQRLVREGRLVALGDSTEFWVLRNMDHSTPYVTPDTRANLVELGRRFHARLDQLGLPRYRMKVTSALRTDDTQADLRRINSYASQTRSAHEFGTTVDVSHERFAVPAPGADASMAWALEAEMLEELGKENARVLQAELGRALAELRTQGAVHVMMENKQPVYHFTLARPFTARSASR